MAAVRTWNPTRPPGTPCPRNRPRSSSLCRQRLPTRFPSAPPPLPRMRASLAVPPLDEDSWLRCGAGPAFFLEAVIINCRQRVRAASSARGSRRLSRASNLRRRRSASSRIVSWSGRIGRPDLRDSGPRLLTLRTRQFAGLGALQWNQGGNTLSQRLSRQRSSYGGIRSRHLLRTMSDLVDDGDHVLPGRIVLGRVVLRPAKRSASPDHERNEHRPWASPPVMPTRRVEGLYAARLLRRGGFARRIDRILNWQVRARPGCP